MIVFKKSTDIRKYLDRCKNQHQSVGFVPTMGALHVGHISLIEASRKTSSVTVCSIFVNPAQFNDPDDFDKYPSTIEKDIDALEKAGCSVLFLPSVAEMYPDGFDNAENYDLGFLETVLEGTSRPGHFQGVCLVVDRLLRIIQPDDLFLGQKDYQQCMVLTKLVELKKYTCRINICATRRETDGLAMSSRNTRLSPAGRNIAAQLFQTLIYLKSTLKQGDQQSIKMIAAKQLTDAGFTLDYLEIANADTLQPMPEWDGHQPAVALVAAFIDGVRLIDNLVLTEPLTS